jgi:hypothetical protein
MPQPQIPDDIREFISQHIDSVVQLEALLLLRRYPHADWDVATTANRLYATERDTLDALDGLCTDGVLQCEAGFYRYDAANEKRDELVGRLAEFYARHLVPITNMIHAKPGRIHRFADAFKLRKDR